MRLGGEFVDSERLFDRKRRGYSTRQVEEYLREVDAKERSHLSRIRQLEHELTLVVRQRDWECRVSTERENQIDSLQHRIAQLTEELNTLEQTATSNYTPGTRIQKMLSLAEEEARAVVRESKREADEIVATATDESRELTTTAKDLLSKANNKAEEVAAECSRLVTEARAEARRIGAEAAKGRDEVESEAKFRRAHMDSIIQSELDRKRKQSETMMREQEDDALRAAEEIVANAKTEAATLIQKAQNFVENYRHEFERIELSRSASVSQMVALRDSLEGLIRTCGRTPRVRELESRNEQPARA